MNELKKIEKIGLYDEVDKSFKYLSFSLVDYRNNYFTSNSLNKIEEFYEGFENREELIKWMMERPKGFPIIHSIEGDSEIIIVIPTADFNGKFAKECREKIFKGVKIIFIESGSNKDFYFNFAHYVNTGISRAMQYNPKWIIFSGDDMYKIDDITKLNRQLSTFDADVVDMVYTRPSRYHSIPVCLGKSRILRNLAFLMVLRRKKQLDLERRFKVSFFSYPRCRLNKFFFNCYFKYTAIATFAIFSRKLILSLDKKPYDETYINAAEDIDLDLRLNSKIIKTVEIDYKIGDYIGSTLGNNNNRRMREISGYTLLNYKIERGIISLRQTIS